MDSELQHGLWNCIFELLEELPGSPKFENTITYRLIRSVWRNVKHDAVDDVSHTDYIAIDAFKRYFLRADWDEAYEILECIVKQLGKTSTVQAEFIKACNAEMTRHNGGYRFVQDELAPIASQEEILEIEGAISRSRDPVVEHLTTALGFLSDRESPNYRNSVKESISAVEAAVGELTKDGLTLGQGLNALKLDIHPALKAAYSKIYGYSSDEGGIRHSLNDESRAVTQEEARYMLISCSAFINYLRAVAAHGG